MNRNRTDAVSTLPVATLVLVAALATSGTVAADAAAEHADRFARLALQCVHREYPNKIAHVLNSDADVAPPRDLTPAFFGCYDWHSSVHGHWLLARVAHRFTDLPAAADARAALARSLTPAKVAAEVRYLEGDGRATFERPYGLAWLLQLAAELRSWDDPVSRGWAEVLGPLERVTADRFRAWVPKLAYPIRTGEHSQTAFAFGLALDWARLAGDDDLAAILEERTRALYLGDRDCPLSYEPSGQDFLSPCLAEADLVRRVLSRDDFAAWLQGFLPGIPTDGGAGWLVPGVVTDPTDGKLAHLDGLNLSRAWMLEGIAAALPDDDARRAAILAAAAEHQTSGLAAVTGAHYEGGHWLGSFATYLVTGRGLPTGAVPTRPTPSPATATATATATAGTVAPSAPPDPRSSAAPGTFAIHPDLAARFDGRGGRPYGRFDVADGATLANWIGRPVRVAPPATVVTADRGGARLAADLVRDGLVETLRDSDLAPAEVTTGDVAPPDGLLVRTTIRYAPADSVLSRARFEVEVELVSPDDGGPVARYGFLDYAAVREPDDGGPVTIDNLETRMRSLAREIRRALR